MKGVKNLNLEDFCYIMNLVQLKEHLTPEGLFKIKSIKEGMNFGRI